MTSEYHEHPFFNRQRHLAVWVKIWNSTGTNDPEPSDVPVSCAICGRFREDNQENTQLQSYVV